MPAWPGTWDGLETFEAALHAWGASSSPDLDVLAQAKRWIGTRQGNPHDADAMPGEGLLDDIHVVRAWVRDLYLRPVEMAGGYVACVYEIHENEHRLNCLYFTIRRGGRPAG